VGTSSLREVLRTWTGFLSPELSRLSSLKLERRPSTESAKGERNDTLFHHPLAQAPYVDDLDTLMDAVRTRNMECEPPLWDVEVANIATSAWRYQEEGRNLVGRGHAIVIDHGTFDTLMTEGPDAWLLYSYLRRQHWGRDFVLTKAMAASMHWGVPRWRAAREALEKLGFIKCLHRGGNGPHAPPFYQWT